MILWNRTNRGEWCGWLVSECVYLLTRQRAGGWEAKFWPCSHLARTLGQGDLKEVKVLCEHHFVEHVWPRVYHDAELFKMALRRALKDELLPHPRKARRLKIVKA